MKPLKPLSVLILIASALLLSGVKNVSAASDQKRYEEHHSETTEQGEKPQEKQPVLVPSQAYQAAILGALRAIVHEEVSRQEQEHADYKRWNTPTFWFGTIGLLVVGALYTFFAGWQLVVIRKQGKTALDQLRMNTRPYVEMFADTLFDDVGTQTMTAYFSLVNVGERDAEIEEQAFVLWTFQATLPYPQEVPFDDESPKPLPETFESHDRRSNQVTHRKLSLTVFVGSESTWDFYLAGRYVACLAGYIRYRDNETKQLHETHFCRSWNHSAREFGIPPKMPDTYNHST
jgi:hypothetical protein